MQWQAVVVEVIVEGQDKGCRWVRKKVHAEQGSKYEDNGIKYREYRAF
jgi:hypothetical protein